MSAVRCRLRTDPGQVDRDVDILIDWMTDPKASAIALHKTIPKQVSAYPSTAALEFLTIAVAVYAADRCIERRDQPDGWTRTIELEVPIERDGRWDTALLSEAIGFLTGDHWSIKFHPGAPQGPNLESRSPGEIADHARLSLFSGGIDSLAGVYDLQRANDPLVLVSYFGDGPTGGLQAKLADRLRRGSDSPVLPYRFRLVEAAGAKGLGDRWPGFCDSTMRSRSLLFLGLAVLVADGLGLEAVTMPENGYIAINVPLHAGRVGSLSTRTSHPHFIRSLNDLLEAAGIGIEIRNPYLNATKGEVSEGLLRSAPLDAIKETISCAHPVGRWQGEGFRNCGYCYPCLIRRAGLHHAGRDPTSYADNPLGDDGFYRRRPAAAADIRGVARSLLESPRPSDVLATGPIKADGELADLFSVYRRGFNELRTLIQDQGTPKVKAQLGV